MSIFLVSSGRMLVMHSYSGVALDEPEKELPNFSDTEKYELMGFIGSGTEPYSFFVLNKNFSLYGSG